MLLIVPPPVAPLPRYDQITIELFGSTAEVIPSKLEVMSSKKNSLTRSKEFWELSKNINSDDEESYDPGASSNKKGPKISVKKSKW